MGDDPDAGPSDLGEREAAEKWQRELKQRERGLDDFADELDEREAELEENAAELRDRRKQLDEREAELDDREARIAEREAELDDRETAIAERERELSERASELDEKERTLEEYVTDNVHEAVQSAASETMKRYRTSRRFGTIGSLVLALVGVTLIIGGVLYGFGDEIARVPLLFDSDGANLGVTVLLLFSGLAANLAAVAD